VSHNAPVNMATNSPNRPAVANNASFAMHHGYPSCRVRHPVNTQFSQSLVGTGTSAKPPTAQELFDAHVNVWLTPGAFSAVQSEPT
jgi:hypothetical protein